MYSQNPYAQYSNNYNQSVDPYYPPQKSFGYSRSNNNYAPSNPVQYDDAMRDYNQIYNQNMKNNIDNGQALSGLEFQMDAERKQTRDIRQKMENDLEIERQKRQEFEKLIIQFRNSAQENELKIYELENQVQGLGQDKESLIQENRAMHNEFIRGQEQFNQKLREYEERCKQQHRHIIQMEDKYNKELKSTTSQYEEKLAECKQSLKQKQESYEAQIISLKRQVSDLNQDLTNAMNDNMRIRIEAEEEIRETVVRVQEEEMRKYMSHIRNIEQKLKASEEGRELLLKQNNDLIHQEAEKDRIIKSNQMKLDQVNSKFKQDMSEFQNQLNQANLAREKLRNELQAKDQISQRLQGDFMDMQRQMAKLKEQHLQNISQIQEENTLAMRDLERRLDQQAKDLNQHQFSKQQMEEVIERLQQELEQLGGNIQNNIQKSISQAMNQTNLASKFDNRKPYFGQKYN